MRIISGLFIAAALAVTLSASDAQQTAGTIPAPTVSPAIDGIMAIFRDHPLVGLGDDHGMAQEEDFYAALIRDPRFAQEVGNVVLEAGEASSQPIIDRYVNGENVPYEELRKVWSNPVGWIPTVTSLGLVNVYATIRDVNNKLPVGQRIHVWLGDPPIDWTKMQSQSDIGPILGQRDSYPASLIEREILQKNKKALVIYGTFHFYGTALWTSVSQSHPGAFIRITPYTGFVEKSCSEDFERQIASWPQPALANRVQGTTLAAQLQKVGCHFNPPNAVRFSPNTPQDVIAKTISNMEDESSGVAGEAFLYLGPAASLTRSPIMPDIYLDSRYRDEIAHHNEVRGLPPLGINSNSNPASPVKLHPY